MTIDTSSGLTSGRITVGPLETYYDEMGSGPPLLLLHGGLSTAEGTFHVVRPSLAQHYRTIAVEQQGHGHTADIDRPMTFERMAEDTASVLRELGVERVDVIGYSDGGNVAIGLALRYPELVGRLVIAGTNADTDGLVPEVLAYFHQAKPEEMGFLAEALDAVAPVPGQFPVVLDKVMRLGREFPGWSDEELASISSPVLVIIGDRDIVRPEHAVEIYRTVPESQLAIVPGRGHETLMEADDLDRLLLRFLTASDTAGGADRTQGDDE